jgi:aldose 1-epimerase
VVNDYSRALARERNPRDGVAMMLRTSILLLLCSTVLSSLGAQAQDKPSKAKVEKTMFGKMDNGTQIDLFTLTNSHGAVAKVMTYGATLVELWMPDRNGKTGDVILGFDDLKGYLQVEPYLGATVGRMANRIAKGKFTLDGKEYSLETNDGPNSLHSGKNGLSHMVWKGEELKEGHGSAVRFTFDSPDGDEGFPGAVSISVTYTLTESNELKLNYKATTDKATPLNLTNHTYFNLGGEKDILSHVMYLNADKYTPVDSTLIPTGEILPVKGTPLDFTAPVAIGAHIAEMQGKPGGYDHNYVVNGEMGKMRIAARAYDPESGRQMEVWTVEPGVQFYSGNFLDGTLTGKRGMVYNQHAGFCLETQHFPDSVNQPKFPSVIVHPGATYHTETILKFSTKK